MDPITRAIASAAAGAAGAGDATYVDDVFSTFLYEGNGSTQTITNGIDLSGEGGLVWIKDRDNGNSHALQDTERGVKKVLYSNSDVESQGPGSGNVDIYQFNNNGFNLGTTFNGYVNTNNTKYVSWTFRKAPGFFDVVTYTGTGSAQNISHSLGSVPGMIIIKRTSLSENWATYHRTQGATKTCRLNGDFSFSTSSSTFNNTEPTSTVFTVGTNSEVNTNGETFVAYLFAHDDQSFGTDSDESIIKCGSFTVAGNAVTGDFIDVGFEPQFVLTKASTATGNWLMNDVIRGAAQTDYRYLRADLSNEEGTISSDNFYATSTGFRYRALGAVGTEIVYMAIRRPNKPPTAGTDVFAVDSRGGTSPTPPTFYSGFPVDLVTRRDTYESDWVTRTRLLGQNQLLQFNTNAAESSQSMSAVEFDQSNGVGSNTGDDANNYAWMFKRAPGFFDVVAYTGNSTSGRTVGHNLTVVPEMMIVKKRSSTGTWQVYHSSQGNTKYSPSFRTDPFYTSSKRWNNTSPTSTQFTVGNDNDVNGSSLTYVAYLFATLDGISKVGSYSGTGSAQNIDCGFTNGARFVLIKRADTEIQGSAPSRTNWYVWDSTRGIVSGNDPWFALNERDAQVTNTDYIDPLNAGFTVSSTGSGLNASGGTYIFLAIA